MRLNLEREQAIRLVVDEVNDSLNIAYSKEDGERLSERFVNLASGAVYCAIALGVLSPNNGFFMLDEIDRGIRRFDENRVLRLEGLA